MVDVQHASPEKKKSLPKKPRPTFMRQVINVLMLARNVYKFDKRLMIWKDEFQEMKLGEFDIRRMYCLFRQIDMDGVNRINIEEMMLYFGVECTRFAKEMFSILSVDICRTLNFRDFVLCMWNFLTLNDDAIYLFGFDLYDKNNNNELELSEVKRMLKDLYSDHFETSKRAMALYQRVRLRGERIGPQEFKEYARNNPALFFPAFDMQQKIRKQVIGKIFWKSKAKSRAKCAIESCPRVKDLLAFCSQKDDNGLLVLDTTASENSLGRNSWRTAARGTAQGSPVYPKGSPQHQDTRDGILNRYASAKETDGSGLSPANIEPSGKSSIDKGRRKSARGSPSKAIDFLLGSTDSDLSDRINSNRKLKRGNESGKAVVSTKSKNTGRRATITSVGGDKRRVAPESAKGVELLGSAKSPSKKTRRNSVS